MKNVAAICVITLLTASSCKKDEPPAGTIALTANFVTSTRVDLTWSDDVEDEVSYLVLRSTDGTTFTEIVTLTKNNYGYSDTTVTAGTIYYYYVVANKRVRSDVNSNTVTVGGGFAKGYNAFLGTGEERFWELRATADAGCLIGGFTSSNAGSQNDLLAMRLTGTSAITFQRTYGGAALDEQGGSVFPTSDGGYVIAGTSGTDIWVVKINNDATIAWQNLYQVGVNESIANIIQTSDGGYLVAGSKVGAILDKARPILIKLDSSGNITWQNQYDIGAQSGGNMVLQASDGSYMLVANFGGVGANTALVKVNSDGTVAWTKSYGTAGTERGENIAATSDGGFIFAVVSDGNALVLKLSSAGAIEWQNTYSGAGTDNAYMVLQSSDGGYVFVGDTDSFGAGDFDYWVMKLTSTGAISWQKSFGGAGTDNSYALALGSDGSMFVGGETNSFNPANTDIWVMKLAADGATTFSTQSGFSIGNTNMAVAAGTATSGDIATIIEAYTLAPVATTEVGGSAATVIENVAGSNGLSTAPSTLTAVAGANPGEIVLNWADNSTDENGFVIFRSTNAVNFTRVAVVQSGTTNFTDTGLITGTTYTYKVEAYTSSGYSNFSNTIGAIAP